MSDHPIKLKSPPIIEAVLDINCDMPPGLDFAVMEMPFRDALRDHYPKVRTQHMQAVQVQVAPAVDRTPNVTTTKGIQAFQFLQDDEKQLLQVRPQGFSFNRLSPYSSLDDYLPEIKRAWKLFLGIAAPVQVRDVRLRYINRFLIPQIAGRVDLDKYLKLGPRLPDEDSLTLVGFLNQQSAAELKTGNQVNIILAAQPLENDKLPIILDIEAFRIGNAEPNDWAGIQAKILSLRQLKNTVFTNSLTDQCLHLFQQ